MNMQQVVQPRSSNGFVRRKVERDAASRFDNKFQSGKTNSSKISLGKERGLVSPSGDRLIYVTTCLIGQQVEVQVQDGSVISGLFHATNADDFGIVLKMAHVIKDGSRGQKTVSPPARTFIIPAKDLVQVIAKEVSLSKDGLTNDPQNSRQQELMTDSCISQFQNVELGRKLEPWIPDENDPGCPALENTFDNHWNRGWDQFEANATLFGVKSTFNEELYTTKLERGPHMRELEREATQLAREIEGEETLDLHLAEERGIQFDDNFEIDEETRFSSVQRKVGDDGYDETENILLDSRNDETFGDASSIVIGKHPISTIIEKTNDGTHASSRSLMEEIPSSVTANSRDANRSDSEYDGQKLLTNQLSNQPVNDASSDHDNPSVGHAESSCNEDKEKSVLDQNGASKSEDASLRSQKEGSDKFALSPNATAFDPACVSSKGHEKASSSHEPSGGKMAPKPSVTAGSLARPSSSTSSTSDRGDPSSSSIGRVLSSSSSVGSLSSEKSILNPHAKEFKLNPNAKIFLPYHAPARPSSPLADGSFYYPANVAAVTQMPGMAVGIGMGPFIPQQRAVFNPQAAMPQQYHHSNVPQYGQQMIMGQPRPVVYMPTYLTEMMPYKGRDY